MRAVYRNPKELATHIKDLIDTYQENLISYEKLEEKIIKIIQANGERVFKDGNLSIKIENVLGEERVIIIKEIAKNNNL